MDLFPFWAHVNRAAFVSGEWVKGEGVLGGEENFAIPPPLRVFLVLFLREKSTAHPFLQKTTKNLIKKRLPFSPPAGILILSIL